MKKNVQYIQEEEVSMSSSNSSFDRDTLFVQLDKLAQEQNIDDSKINVFIYDEDKCRILNDIYNASVTSLTDEEINKKKEITFTDNITFNYTRIDKIKYQKDPNKYYYVIIADDTNFNLINTLLAKEGEQLIDGNDLLSNYIILTLIMYLKEYIEKVNSTT